MGAPAAKKEKKKKEVDSFAKRKPFFIVFSLFKVCEPEEKGRRLKAAWGNGEAVKSLCINRSTTRKKDTRSLNETGNRC